MNSIKVRNLDIGAGIPKICVPIVGTDRTAILDAAKRIPGSAAESVSPDPQRIWQSGAQTGMKIYSMNRKPGRC